MDLRHSCTKTSKSVRVCNNERAKITFERKICIYLLHKLYSMLLIKQKQ